MQARCNRGVTHSGGVSPEPPRAGSSTVVGRGFPRMKHPDGGGTLTHVAETTHPASPDASAHTQPERLVLVAYASKYGSTKGVAERIGARLRERGHRVEVRAVDQTDGVDTYRVFAGVIDRHQWPLFSRLFYYALGGRLGDNRDWPDIDAWAQHIAQTLQAPTPRKCRRRTEPI